MNARDHFLPYAGASRPDRGPAEIVPQSRSAGQARSALATGAVLGVLWAGLHWSDPASWVIGLPVMLLGGATAFLVPASRGPRLSPLGAIRFAGFALRGIGSGAVDVGLRSLRPGSLDCGCFPYRTRLPQGRPRRLFAVAITLLPGTLTARLDDDRLVVHALDRGEATRREIAALEDSIARLFDLDAKGPIQ